eukprot:s512_g34.t1
MAVANALQNDVVSSPVANTPEDLPTLRPVNVANVITQVSNNGADEVKKVRPVRPMALRTIKKVVRTSTTVVQTGATTMRGIAGDCWVGCAGQTPLEREVESIEGLRKFSQKPPAEVSGRVSVLTPTTASRARFHEQLWQCFIDQTWPDKEDVFDHKTLGRRSLVALTLSAWHNFFESSCRCGYSTPECWEPEDEEEYEGILYGYGFSYVYLRALALSFPYPNLGFAEEPLAAAGRGRAGRVGLKEDMEGLCLHIVHPSSSTPDPEIETMLSEEELNGLVVSDSMACRLHLKRPWFPSIWWSSGLAELDPPLPSSVASYLFEGIDALRDGHLTPPELQGTLDIGQLFQSQEALREALHWDKATMQHHVKASSWIHDAQPNWQHQQNSAGKVVKGPAKKRVKDSQKLPLVQSMLGAFLTASDAFDSMDKDHSDDASIMEFKETLAHFQPPISGFQAEQAFRNLDRDGNGKVSRAEFAVLNAEMPTGGSLDQNMHQLMSKAEEEFRKQASKWAGGMKQACMQLGTQVSFQHFQSAIRSFEPLLSAEVAEAIFNEMDSNHNGFIDPKECHLSLKDFRKTMSGSNSLRNTFVAADRDNDHQLSEEEFDHFGQMLDPHISRGKYAIFFEDALDTDHDGKVGLPTLETLLGDSKKADAHDDLLSAGDLPSYDLPAIMHGKCIFTAPRHNWMGRLFLKCVGCSTQKKTQ